MYLWKEDTAYAPLLAEFGSREYTPLRAEVAGHTAPGEHIHCNSGDPVTYIISETCVDVKDRSCAEVCPVDCIHGTDDDRMLYIDPDECIDCGACVDPCPVDAIYAAEDLPVTQQAYAEINRLYFKDRAVAHQRIDDLVPRPSDKAVPASYFLAAPVASGHAVGEASVSR